MSYHLMYPSQLPWQVYLLAFSPFVQKSVTQTHKSKHANYTSSVVIGAGAGIQSCLSLKQASKQQIQNVPFKFSKTANVSLSLSLSLSPPLPPSPTTFCARARARAHTHTHTHTHTLALHTYKEKAHVCFLSTKLHP
jgi:hypothetical protein